MQVTVREEVQTDLDEIRTVITSAFGQTAEADLVDALRDQGDEVLSMVAVTETGAVVGHILFSRISIVSSHNRIDALALAPMAVLPKHQREGIGSQLVCTGIDQCKALSERIIIVVGHPEYYPRFGFSSTAAKTITAPFDVPANAWMAMELAPGALQGVAGKVEYPPAFQAVT